MGSQGRAPRGSEIQVELKEKWDLAARGGGAGMESVRGEGNAEAGVFLQEGRA